jgi:hypothetical protein
MDRIRTIAGVGMLLLAAGAGTVRGEIRVEVLGRLSPVAEKAVSELRAIANARGGFAKKSADISIVVGTAANDGAIGAALQAAGVTLAAEPEATALAKVGEDKLLVGGFDERGLAYAVRDVARAIELNPAERPLAGIESTAERPFLRVRNVSVHLFNADVEREWYFAEAFWHDYFRMLSRSRFNHFTLTFCDQTNYLCPPYAYLVEMPEYPQVRAENVTPAVRAKNLSMLTKVSDLAGLYGIDFNLGLWMQAPVPRWSAPVRVHDLPEGMKLAEYCATGLARILKACPSIRGVQLRMNEEAGVKPEEQTDFYRPMFQAMRGIGRPLRLDLRYKGLQQATIDAATAEKLDVTVSTKFWAEHFGQPYHPLVVDSHWAADRYSYGTLLKKPLRHRVTYQLWNVGSQRLTLWGDPQYAADFARSCTLGGGEGFEMFAPLTNKGYGDAPGAWPVIKNPEYRVGRWEQDRYWMFYLALGRMGYSTETNPEIWRREFRHRFGDEAAPHVERAYAAASRVLPWITTALLPGASEWSWWPEMDTGGDLETYSYIQPSDTGRFAPLRTWKKTAGWRWEEWDALPTEPQGRHVTAFLAGKLRDAARGIQSAWKSAEEASHEVDAEWRMTDVDLRLLAGLAEYHAHKLKAAQALVMRQADKSADASAPDDKSLEAVAGYELEQSLAAWKKIVAATDGVYHDDLVFGISADSPRSKQGHHHTGHWRDRLKELEADMPRRAEVASDSRLFDRPHRNNSVRAEHTPPKSFRRGEPLEIEIVGRRESKNPLIKSSGSFEAVLHYRSLDQTQPWQSVAMTTFSKVELHARWTATIPGAELDRPYDLQYFFTFGPEGEPTGRWPEPADNGGQPYFVVPLSD